jgi:flagellin
MQQGVSMLQVADGAMQGITDQLQHLREVAVSASNGTNSPEQFAAYQTDVQNTLSGIDAVANGTQFNSKNLLDGSIAGTPGSMTLQVGPDSGNTMDISNAFGNNTSGGGGLGITQTTIASTADANALLSQVDSALSTVTSNLSVVGGYENSLSSQLDNVSIAKVNTASAQSTIRDTDVAAETAQLTRLTLLRHSAVSALKKGNDLSQMALGLLHQP